MSLHFFIGVIPKRFKPFEITIPTDDKQEIIASIFHLIQIKHDYHCNNCEIVGINLQIKNN